MSPVTTTWDVTLCNKIIHLWGVVIFLKLVTNVFPIHTNQLHNYLYISINTYVNNITETFGSGMWQMCWFILCMLLLTFLVNLLSQFVVIRHCFLWMGEKYSLNSSLILFQYLLKRYSTPKQPIWANKLYLFQYKTIPQSAKSPKAPISWQHPHTFQERVLLFQQLIGQRSQINLGII